MNPVKTSKEIKEGLRQSLEDLRQPRSLETVILPYLENANGKPHDWETKIIQLDGSGAATLEIKLHGVTQVFAKIFPDDEGPEIYGKLQDFRSAGFGDGEFYQTVEPVAFIPDRDLLICRPAPGTAVADYIASDQEKLVEGCKHSGAWLAKLHCSPLRTWTPRSLLTSSELLPLSRRLAKMLCRRPQHLSLVLELIDDLETLAADTVEGIFVQSHGQYRPIHVFVEDSKVTVIDLDRSRPRDPAFDLAEFLHRTRMTTFWRTDSVDGADAPTRAFLAAYHDGTSGRPYLKNLRFHWARYIFHSLNNKLKSKNVTEAEQEKTIEFYRAEFQRVLDDIYELRELSA